MATIESLQLEISELRSDIMKLSVKFASKKELDNLKFNMVDPVKFNKHSVVLMGMVTALGYQVGNGGLVAGAGAVTAAGLAKVGLSLAKLTKIFAPFLAAGQAAASAAATVLLQLGQAMILTYGILEVIKRIDIEISNIYNAINLTYDLSKAQLDNYKAKNAIAISALKQEDKKNQKEIKATYIKLDKEDTRIKNRVKTVDAKAIAAQITADVVTDNHDKLVITFNGFSNKVNAWIKEATGSIKTWSELTKQSLTQSNYAKNLATSAVVSVNELKNKFPKLENQIVIITDSIATTKSKLSGLEAEIKKTITTLEEAITRHDSLADNFAKLKLLIQTWTIESNKALNYLGSSVNKMQQEINKLKTMQIDITPVLTKLNILQADNTRSHDETQSMLKAGFITAGIGITANGQKLTAIGSQVTQLSTGVTQGFTTVTQTVNNGFKTVNAATTAISTAITNTGNKIKKLADNIDFSFILNLISAAGSLHNAVMLSQNVLQTFFMVFDNLFQIFGIEDSSGNPLSIANLIGKKIEDIVKSSIGVKTYEEIAQKWNAYNRIYQAATNSFYAIQGLFSSLSQFSVNISNNLGKIGNALLTHVFDEDEYATMSENLTNTGRLKWLNNYSGSANEVLQFASALQQITGDVLSITQEVKEVKDSVAEFDKAVDESTQKVAAKKATENKDSDLLFPDAEMSVLDIFEGGL